MSHQPERKEKDCLNCGSTVIGRYCHQCGQENIVNHQSFLSLTKHFVYDILHFDGKFFHTVGYIFSRPGFVARQYAEGKRMRYLDPIRMYLFTSAVFFLVFFSINAITPDENVTSGWLSNKERRELAESYQKRVAKNPADSSLQSRVPILLDTTQPLNIDSLGWREGFTIIGRKQYRSLSGYDSVQKALPPKERDSWVSKHISKQGLKLKQKYRSGDRVGSILIDSFLHRLPYLLFVSLPFFALILKLLYVRRKQFYYSDHAVFTLYHYIFSFILLLLAVGLDELGDWLDWGIFSFLTAALIIYWPVHLAYQLKNFYRQSWGKTIGKFFLLNLAGLFILILLFIIFLLFSIFQL
ncbi:DUF3667 domain-containing protein [Flavisolibacter sp. BT320]|nr:DUF3667 domain-containing protein [Flavisolibacter longurius]